MATVQKRVTGCIIRHYTNDDNDFDRLAAHLKVDYDEVELIKLTRDQAFNKKRYVLRHVRMGNLDLSGWMEAYAHDLSEIEIEYGLNLRGDSLDVSFELVYGGD